MHFNYHITIEFYNNKKLTYFPKTLISWPKWVHRVSQVSHLMTVFSSSVNYYIYLAKHRLGQEATMGPDSTTEDQALDTATNNQVRIFGLVFINYVETFQVETVVCLGMPEHSVAVSTL